MFITTRVMYFIHFQMEMCKKNISPHFQLKIV